jgi:hypothetical protein
LKLRKWQRPASFHSGCMLRTIFLTASRILGLSLEEVGLQNGASVSSENTRKSVLNQLYMLFRGLSLERGFRMELVRLQLWGWAEGFSLEEGGFKNGAGVDLMYTRPVAVYQWVLNGKTTNRFQVELVFSRFLSSVIGNPGYFEKFATHYLHKCYNKANENNRRHSQIFADLPLRPWWVLS